MVNGPTKLEKILLVAKAVGWVHSTIALTDVNPWWCPPESDPKLCAYPPENVTDYFLSLDDCATMRRRLTIEQQPIYAEHLRAIVALGWLHNESLSIDYLLADAGVEHHREAFARTLKLW